jgi:hypothetical protein
MRVAKGGSDYFVVVIVEDMELRLRVSAIILVNPAVITITIINESNPPVRVLYSVSLLYLRS